MKRAIVVIALAILGGFFSGCVDTKQKGKEFVEGAIDAGAVFAEAKNKAALADAMADAAAVGMDPHSVDANGDGFFDEGEAWQFAKDFAVLKAKVDGNAAVKEAIESLKSGDLAGVKQAADKAKDSAIGWLEAVLGILTTAAGTVRYINWSRDRKYKRPKQPEYVDDRGNESPPK